MKAEQEFETVESGVMEASKTQAIRDGEHNMTQSLDGHQGTETK